MWFKRANYVISYKQTKINNLNRPAASGFRVHQSIFEVLLQLREKIVVMPRTGFGLPTLLTRSNWHKRSEHKLPAAIKKGLWRMRNRHPPSQIRSIIRRRNFAPLLCLPDLLSCALDIRTILLLCNNYRLDNFNFQRNKSPPHPEKLH